MLKRYTIKTERRGLYNITSYVRQAVTESGVQEGVAVIFCPHTTAAITINENADPDVKTDLWRKHFRTDRSSVTLKETLTLI